ncbi:MAG: inhibitor of KinA [Roseivirga sp.]|jgi:inhibitor of KinA
MKILAFGDSALLVNFEQKIDEATNQKVIDLATWLKTKSEVTYLIPAYCSLTVGFDTTKHKFEQLSQLIEAFDISDQTKQNEISKTIEIPVCYADEFALDLEDVMAQTGLSKAEIIKLHTHQVFKVYMLGFIAGFAYMGALPDQLKVSRKQQPRKIVHEGAVGLAGVQTGIYPTDAPGGWQIIGQCPTPMFDPSRAQPSYLQPGDVVQFKSISRQEFSALKAVSSNREVTHD